VRPRISGERIFTTGVTSLPREESQPHHISIAAADAPSVQLVALIICTRVHIDLHRPAWKAAMDPRLLFYLETTLQNTASTYFDFVQSYFCGELGGRSEEVAIVAIRAIF